MDKSPSAQRPDVMQVKLPSQGRGVYAARGAHMTADVWGVTPSLLNDLEALKRRMASAVRGAGATMLKLEAVAFSPSGVTVMAVLAESHASLHTYPEEGVLMADAFTCGDVDPEPLIAALIEGLGSTHHVIRRTARGEGRTTHVEELLSPGMSRIWAIDEVVAEEKTPYQNVLLARTGQGATLFCNRERQSSELTQLIYHEGQFVPAALLVDDCKRVLIIGSSEGVVTQLALWSGAEEIIHADIDQRCVELCADHLPYGYSRRDVERYAKGDDSVQLLFEDGVEVVRRLKAAGKRFDVIVMDLPDEEVEPTGQHNRLYGEKFLADLRDLLGNGGVVISQAGCASYWRNETLVRTYQRFASIFPTTVYFELTEQDWVWVIGCQSAVDDPVHKMQSRLKTLSYRPAYIDEQVISAATIPPAGFRRLISKLN